MIEYQDKTDEAFLCTEAVAKVLDKSIVDEFGQPLFPLSYIHRLFEHTMNASYHVRKMNPMHTRLLTVPGYTKRPAWFVTKDGLCEMAMQTYDKSMGRWLVRLAIVPTDKIAMRCAYRYDRVNAA